MNHIIAANREDTKCFLSVVLVWFAVVHTPQTGSQQFIGVTALKLTFHKHIVPTAQNVTVCSQYTRFHCSVYLLKIWQFTFSVTEEKLSTGGKYIISAKNAIHNKPGTEIKP